MKGEVFVCVRIYVFPLYIPNGYNNTCLEHINGLINIFKALIKDIERIFNRKIY